MSQLLSAIDCVHILSKTVNIKFNINKFTMKNINSETLGFLGEHLLLKIFYTLEGNNAEPLEATFFIKAAPQARGYVTDLGFIKREVTFYKEIISKLQAFVSVKFSPDFYFGRDDILVLENLQAKNFSVSHDRYLCKEKILSVITNLANMHAASIIFENMNGTMLGKFYADLTQNIQDYCKESMRYEWRKNGVKCVAKLCNYFTNNSDIEARVLEYFDKEASEFEKVNKSIVNVFCHKDLWGNNLMFNEKNECCFVDFQLSKYGPPEWDFLSALYFNINYGFVEGHMRDFIDIYYDIFFSVLSNKDGVKPFTKEEFVRTVEVYKKPVLFEVCSCCTYIYLASKINTIRLQKEVMYDFDFGDRSKFVFEEIAKNKDLKERFRDIILPLCNMFD